MYYLFNKRDKQNACTGEKVTSTGSRHSLHSYQSRPHPNFEGEGHRSSSGSCVPEEPDSSDQSHHPAHPRQPASGGAESKKKEKQLGTRFCRRRGFQEHDFTEEVMPPSRPTRFTCQRCRRDIARNDGHHRIMCSDRDRHVFCKGCFAGFVEGWVEGSFHCDLRVGIPGSLHSLPCMSPACQKGCLPENLMQPLLLPALFMSCRQKLAKLRSELNRSKLRRGGGGAEATDQPLQRRSLPRHESPRQYEQSSRPSQPQRQPEHPHHSDNQDLVFYQQQQHLRQEHERFQQQRDTARESLQQQSQFLQQEWRSDTNDLGSHHHQQHQDRYQYQHQLEQLQQPMAPQRQCSTQSTASQKTQKTQKSVRFSVLSNEDNMSSGSSASSLTTQHPATVDDRRRKMEIEEANRRHCEMQILDEQKLQQEFEGAKMSKSRDTYMPQQQQEILQLSDNGDLVICECCYEDVSTNTTRLVSCIQKHPGAESHHFCTKCMRQYVEEWVFGAVTYSLRPGPADSQGETSLLLPCLHGDCLDGGFPDQQVSFAISPRSMEEYISKIKPMRIAKEDDEERLVRYAIRLSLDQEELKRHGGKLHEEQESITRGDTRVFHPLPIGPRPPAAVNVPETTLSNTSSLTSINTALFSYYPRSLPDLPGRGTFDVMTFTAKLDEAGKASSDIVDQHIKNCEKGVHAVEEAMTLAKVRTCPNCLTKFLKDEDFCNKLKCPSCKTAICYICRRVIPTQGYEHFCIHKQGGCAACLNLHCPLWTHAAADNRRDMAEMRARGLDEANRIWEKSLLQQTEIRVDVDSLL